MFDGAINGFANRRTALSFELVIFDHDDGVIDQQAERDNQTGHGHLMQRDIQIHHADQDHGRGKWQRDAHRQRRTHAHHPNQHH